MTISKKGGIVAAVLCAVVMPAMAQTDSDNEGKVNYIPEVHGTVRVNMNSKPRRGQGVLR